jgi:hypothetical protein
MLPLSALSRRALVAAAALVTVVPRAEAQTSVPPQVFVKATLSDPSPSEAKDPSTFTFSVTFQAAIVRPASGATEALRGSIFVDATASATAAQAELVSGLQGVVAEHLVRQGYRVPPSLIDVVLL